MSLPFLLPGAECWFADLHVLWDPEEDIFVWGIPNHPFGYDVAEMGRGHFQCLGSATRYVMHIWARQSQDACDYANYCEREYRKWKHEHQCRDRTLGEEQ